MQKKPHPQLQPKLYGRSRVQPQPQPGHCSLRLLSISLRVCGGPAETSTVARQWGHRKPAYVSGQPLRRPYNPHQSRQALYDLTMVTIQHVRVICAQAGTGKV